MKKPVVRHCMGCNRAADKFRLLRLTKTADGRIFYDPTGKSDGRGAYICNDINCLNAVKKSRRLNKVFKCALPEDIYMTLAEVIGGQTV